MGRPLRDMYDLPTRLLEELSQSLTGRSRGASTRSVLQTIKPSANHEPLAANHLKKGTVQPYGYSISFKFKKINYKLQT